MPGCKAPDILSREAYFWYAERRRMRETQQMGVFQQPAIPARDHDSQSSLRGNRESCPSFLYLRKCPGEELDAGQASPVDQPCVYADLVFLEEGLAEGGVAEDDGLPEIPVRIDELVADPEKVLRRLPGKGDSRPEPRVDKEVRRRFVIEGKGGEEAEVVLREAGSCARVGRGKAVRGESHPAAVREVELFVPPLQIIIQEHRLVVSLEADQVREGFFQVEKGLDNPSGVWAAVEVIADENDGVGERVGPDQCEELLQLVIAAVDVADGEYPFGHGGFPPDRPAGTGLRAAKPLRDLESGIPPRTGHFSTLRLLASLRGQGAIY
jgi:hypothetical protein